MQAFNGFLYSKKEFLDYKFRAKVEFKTKGGEHNMDIYTTATDKETVLGFISAKKTDKVTSFKIVNWVSKEVDDLTAEFLNEILDGI